MSATLSIIRNPHGPGTREVTADCPHGTTTLTILDGDPGSMVLTDRAAAVIAVERLLAEEGCRCARRLAKRYGVMA